MKRVSVVAAGVSAAVVMGAAPAAKEPPPIANYWMDVATTSSAPSQAASDRETS